tara:strand:- start:140 stop:394 length:255 start_codon:yes stop_codon:yes gene_type:complete
MNQKQVDLVCVVMEMIGGTIDLMQKDPFHAPEPWVLNNWWNTLNAVLAASDVSEVRNQGDSSSRSLEAADHAESEKGDNDVPLD